MVNKDKKLVDKRFFEVGVLLAVVWTIGVSFIMIMVKTIETVAAIL